MEVKVKDRVRLKEFWDEDELLAPEEDGEILQIHPNGTIMICVDEKCRPAGDYDGLREITANQIKEKI